MSASELELPPLRGRLVTRVEVELGEILDLGPTPAGHRRVVPIVGGRFDGPQLTGEVLPGGADWQVVAPDGSVVVEARYTLRAQGGALVLISAGGVRHGPPEVLDRLARVEPVAPSEYTFRTLVRAETSAAELSWLNRGVFVGVAARESASVVYDLYAID
jgi:hypothetical protein